MIGLFLTVLLLFGLIKFFEKKRDDIETFNLITVAIVPAISSFLTLVAVGAFFPELPLLQFLPLAVLIATTFGLLWKHLEIPAGRSALYALAIVVLNIGLSLFVTPL
jgi:hypothetical protein